MSGIHRAAAGSRRLAGCRDGVAAIEFAVIGSMFAVLMLNVIDFALLIWAQMQVDYAAQAGVQAAYNTCSPGTVPATTNCPTLTSAITTAAQSTSLGGAVSLASGSPEEAYYCTSGNTLELVGSYASPPAPFNCSIVGDPAAAPGDYVTVAVDYPFRPLFSGLTLVRAQTLTASGMQRLR